MNFSSDHFSYRAMRRLLLILMIALLPLRGWAGDAMATGMAAGQAQQMQQMHVATENIATPAHPASAKADFYHETVALPDCAGHDAGDGDHDGDSHCNTCSACQACHTVALTHSAPDIAPVFHAFALSYSAADQYASADTALRRKPPIF